MAIPIIHDWEKYFTDPDEGLGSSYERVVINRVIRALVEKYQVSSILETPSFGFTGLSGINLMNEAMEGREITLEDHDPERLRQIRQIWEGAGYSLKANLNEDYCELHYPDASFDMAYNFSAMWFVRDIRAFIAELTRVTSKVIMISVPNRDGIGFKMQMKDYDREKYPELEPGYIDPGTIRLLMRKAGWDEVRHGYFDCPPWPDIGMSKEDFLEKTLGIKLAKKEPEESQDPDQVRPLTIMDYFTGETPDFEARMMRFYFLEKVAPVWFKRMWAHHYFMVFTPHASQTTI